jgi:hypothetical protein
MAPLDWPSILVGRFDLALNFQEKPMKSTPEMRARLRELMKPEIDQCDLAVMYVLDDLERILQKLGRRAYSLSEPHLSGRRVILGFDSVEAADEAQDCLVDALRAIRDQKWTGDNTHDQMRKIASDALRRHAFEDSGGLNGECRVCGQRNAHRDHDPAPAA